MLQDELAYNIASQSKKIIKSHCRQNFEFNPKLIQNCILVKRFALNGLPLTSNQIASWNYGYDYD